jgi:nucleoid-associated protein YgaU
MNKKVLTLVLIAILIGLSAAACTRSATTKQPEDLDPTIEIPFPVNTLDPAARVTEIVEQTQAAIATPETSSSEPEATPIIVVQDTPAPTATLPVIPTPERPASYTLQKGEWPICVARRYNLDLNSFFNQNGLTMNSRPAEGTVLKIPATGTWSSGDRALMAHPANYTVKAGDTIHTIACAFGDVDPMGIVAANSLQSPYTLSSGQVLRIP